MNRNQNGYTLAEVMIAMGMACFAVILCSSLIMQIDQISRSTQKKSIVEEQRLSMMTYLRLFLSQASFVQLSAAPLANIENSATGIGRIAAFAYGRNAADNTAAAQVQTVAYFWRETNVVTPPPNQSKLQQTAIFFQNPTTDQAGALYISTGPNGVLTPANSNFRFGGIVEFEIQNITTSGDTNSPNQISFLEIRFIVRQQLDDNPNNWGWCPQINYAANCGAKSSAYKDIETVLTVPFRNNFLGTDPMKPWDITLPSTFYNNDKRLYDRIYFFQTRIKTNE